QKSETSPEKTGAAADARCGPDRQALRETSGAAGDAKLARPRKDGVLDVDVGARIDLGIDPVAALGRGLLLEHRDPHAVGPQFAVEDGDLDLHALVGRLGRRVPVGDDDPAERIGRDQGDEVDGVERGPPQGGGPRHAGPGVAALLGLGAEQAAWSEQAALFALLAAQTLVDLALGAGPGG